MRPGQESSVFAVEVLLSKGHRAEHQVRTQCQHCSLKVTHSRNGTQRKHQMLQKMKLLILQGCAKRADRAAKHGLYRRLGRSPGFLNVAHLMDVVDLCTVSNCPLCSASRTTGDTQSCTQAQVSVLSRYRLAFTPVSVL